MSEKRMGHVIALLVLACMLMSPCLRAQTLYASPAGTQNTLCSSQSPCSLLAVQTAIRAHRDAGAITTDVILLDGIYRLSHTMHLDNRDSGAPGHPICWHAAARAHPVLIGSRHVTGAREGQYWEFALQPDEEAASSIYLHGQRRLPDATDACPDCKVDENGLFNIPPAVMQRLQAGSLARVHVRWRDFHCRITALGNDQVSLAQPCWHNTAIDSRNDWKVASPFGKYYHAMDGFDDLGGMPREPGTYTVDTARHRLHYLPHADELPQTPTIDIPVLETLLSVAGTHEKPVHDLVFEGIDFANTSWHQARTDDGYVSLQAGYLVQGRGRQTLPDNGEGMTRINSAVSIRAGRNIVFDHDTFHHLAAAGIAFVDDSHGVAITHSRFTDIGGGAIFVGDITAHPPDADAKTSDVLIADNQIDHVALTYRDNVAIMAGFVNGLDLLHNTITDLPYSGISVGWGWNFEGTGPVQSAIHIVGNRVERVMLQLADGGAIYTQGESTPGTSCITRNAIDMHHSGEGNGIYLDEHSFNFDVERNVVLGAWISAWADWSGNLRIAHNWTDSKGTPHNPGPTKIWAPNVTDLATLPADAVDVQRAAGAHVDGALPTMPISIAATCPRD
ncbi:right-handed parallel beta-helix repeat-containing protein [Dyella monticola]|uniref:Right-handed parallel beta-helix repeat-containing protein n=1 Tax=Dyella monticola TaxID=1927958 RepID=A0A370X592_9GAMM|nr:right-handed parallel beta-helix repeat-containing protein [Dyella monticola]RDS83502.1 right-handed parallel beta-helix repeat-containing protein [Dyella monticola]